MRLSGNLAWDVFGWTVTLAMTIFGPHWFAVVAVVVYLGKDIAASRAIYWQHRLIELRQHTGEIPEGFVRVSVPGRAPVVVPATEEAVAAVRHLVEIVEGDE